MEDSINKRPDKNPKDSSRSLKDVIVIGKQWSFYLIAKWRYVVLAGVIGGLCGLAYSLVSKPMYKAQLSFVLEDEKSGIGLAGALGLASQLGLEIGGGSGGAFTPDNVPELMTSRPVLENVLLSDVYVEGKFVSLLDRYIQYNDLREEWKNKPLLSNISFPSKVQREALTRIQDSLLGEFCEDLIEHNLVIGKKDKKSSILTVTLNSPDEYFSKYFTEILVREVSEFYVTSKIKKSADNLAILQHQTDSVRRALNAAIGGVAESADINPNPNKAMQVIRVPSQRRQVDVQANTAILTELVKNLELAKVTLRKETPLIQIIEKPVFPLKKRHINVPLGICLGFVAGILIMLIVYTIAYNLKEDQ